MITIRKLLTLKPPSRLRKIVRVLEQTERCLATGPDTVNECVPTTADIGFLARVGAIVDECADVPLQVQEAGRTLAELCGSLDRPARPEQMRRAINRLRHGLLCYLGHDAAEWDLLPSARIETSGASSAIDMARFPITVYLEDVRSPFNVGSIIRTSAAFGIEAVVLSPDCAAADHARARRSAMGADSMISIRRAGLEEIAAAAPHVLALEQGGTPLHRFHFPPGGVVIVGSEELGVSPDALSIADKRDGRVTIPLTGFKASLNVGVAFGVLLSAWTASLAAAAAE